MKVDFSRANDKNSEQGESQNAFNDLGLQDSFHHYFIKSKSLRPSCNQRKGIEISPMDGKTMKE